MDAIIDNQNQYDVDMADEVCGEVDMDVDSNLYGRDVEQNHRSIPIEETPFNIDHVDGDFNVHEDKFGNDSSSSSEKRLSPVNNSDAIGTNIANSLSINEGNADNRVNEDEGCQLHSCEEAPPAMVIQDSTQPVSDASVLRVECLSSSSGRASVPSAPTIQQGGLLSSLFMWRSRNLQTSSINAAPAIAHGAGADAQHPKGEHYDSSPPQNIAFATADNGKESVLPTLRNSVNVLSAASPDRDSSRGRRGFVASNRRDHELRAASGQLHSHVASSQQTVTNSKLSGAETQLTDDFSVVVAGNPISYEFGASSPPLTSRSRPNHRIGSAPIPIQLSSSVAMSPPPSSSPVFPSDSAGVHIPGNDAGAAALQEQVHLPQVLQSLVQVLGTGVSVENLRRSMSALEDCINTEWRNESGRSTQGSRLAQRNAALLTEHRDWITWICNCVLSLRRRIGEDVELFHDAAAAGAASLSESESLDFDHSGTEGYDGGYDSAGIGYKMSHVGSSVRDPSYATQTDYLISQFCDPLFNFIQSLLVIDFRGKTNSTRKYMDVFYLPLPEAKSVQTMILFDVLELMYRQNLDIVEDTLCIFRNLSTFLEQALEKTEVPLDFCVKAIHAINYLSYHAPVTVRSRLKDTMLPEIRSVYVCKCLMEKSEDIFARIASVSEIHTSVGNLICCNDSKVLHSHQIMLLLLGMFVEIIDESEGCHTVYETATMDHERKKEYDKYKLLQEFQLAILVVIRNCSSASSDMRKLLLKIFQDMDPAYPASGEVSLHSLILMGGFTSASTSLPKAAGGVSTITPGATKSTTNTSSGNKDTITAPRSSSSSSWWSPWGSGGISGGAVSADFAGSVAPASNPKDKDLQILAGKASTSALSTNQSVSEVATHVAVDMEAGSTLSTEGFLDSSARYAATTCSPPQDCDATSSLSGNAFLEWYNAAEQRHVCNYITLSF